MTERYQWEPSDDEIAARFGLDPASVVRFDQNTAPAPPSVAADAATRSAATVNEYPDASYRRLRETIAGYTGVEPEQVVIGAGLDELILLAAMAFLQPGDHAVMVEPTYSLHRIATTRTRAIPIEVPLIPPDFDVDADRLLTAATGAALTWLCVPNNPTGTRFGDDLVRGVVEATPGVTILDAAYAEVAGDQWSGWLEDHPRLVVMQTMSKAFGLAGARVGYAIADPGLIGVFDDVRPPGSVSSISVDLAMAALGDLAGMRRRVEETRGERSRLFGLLVDLGLEPVLSHANFLLCSIGPSAPRLADALMSEGLVVRSYGSGPLREHLRFTVRSPEEDDRLVAAFRRHM